MIKVLFVCLGNICRSPMAEAVFRKMAADYGLEAIIETDSCGTSDWHTGEAPHKGTREILKKHGVPFDGIYAQPLKREHFDFDYIIAMDENNLRDIKSYKSNHPGKAEIKLLSDFSSGNWVSVPDPWYTGNFMQTYELVSDGCMGLIDYLQNSVDFNNSDA